MSILRIAHIADSHFDEKNRLDDNVAVHKAFVEQAKASRVDLILHPGDFFERRSTGTERRALREFLTAAAEVAPVIGCRGNHETEDEDLDAVGEIRAAHTMVVLERPTAPGCALRGASPVAMWGVLALPWFTKAHIVASLPADTPAAETTERTIQAARGLLTMLRVEADRVAASGAVPLLVGHIQIAGSETSTGQTLIGTTVELSPADVLEVGCAYAALGHIHKAQSWHDGRVAYSGSPQRMNFGEPEPKGWNLVTIDTERWREPDGVKVEFQALPARAIELVEADVAAGQDIAAVLAATPNGCFNGALVRVRYRIKPEDLHTIDEAEIERILGIYGAHSVKLEAVLVHQDRVRCQEITTAADTKAKCVAYWMAKGIDVPEATRARVFAKLDEIEARV